MLAANSVTPKVLTLVKTAVPYSRPGRRRPRQDAVGREHLFGTDYSLRRDPAHRRFSKAVVQWFRDSKVGWKWLIVVLPLQIVSAWTNVLGMALALPWTAAIVLGVGLQTLALYVGIGLLNSSDEERGRWRKPLVPILCVSVFFSFAGFTSQYSDDLQRKTLPLRQQDDLKQQALELSAKADEGRRLALSAYQNRIDYARTIVSRVRERQIEGGYADPTEADHEIAEMQDRIAAAKEAEAGWDNFHFDPQAALSQPSIGQGFSMLQAAYANLSRLMGGLRHDEAGDYEMPRPPLPTIQAAEQAPKKALVEHAVSQLFSLAGVFWLILAIMLEAIPFWAAHANSAPHRDEDEDEAAPEDLAVADDPQVTREVEAFNARVRPIHFIAAASMGEVERQAGRVDGVVEDHRKAHVEALRLEPLRKTAEIRRRQLEMLVEEGRARGVPERELAKIVQEDWLEVLKDFGVEHVRLERLREERRSEAIQPSEGHDLEMA